MASEPYTLFKVEETIVLKFHQLLEKLESQPQTILCTRGDSKESPEEHASYFEHDLNKVFTVGGKARYNMSDDVKSIYQHTYIKNKNTLQKELESLINHANQAMNRREEEFSVKVREYFTDLRLEKFDVESLLKLKIFFLSFFHTDGRLREFSDNTPFLSMTYGDKKFSIARKFALGKDNPKEQAFIYLYSLNSGDPYYMKTNNLSSELRKLGATWHYDKYHEILLINGMFPHYLLGLLEVKNTKTPRLILNPYLHDLLVANKQFDYVNGMKIDQKNFIEYARSLGYKNYFFSTDDGSTYTDNLVDSNPQEVVRP